MKKSKIIHKYFSLILTLAILITSMPLDSFAAETKTSTPSQEIAGVDQPEVVPEAKIIGELTEKRDEAIKHFMKDDMSFESVVYPMPVHYKKDVSFHGYWSGRNCQCKRL